MADAEHTVNAENSIDVIVCGTLCLDMIPVMEHITLERMVMPGRVMEIGPIRLATGGAVPNTGLALHRLGANVRLMSTVGSDYIGQILIASLKSADESLSQGITVLEGQSSSYTIVLSPENRDRTMLHCVGPFSTFGVDSIDFSALEHAKIFHLGYPTVLPRLFDNDGSALRTLCERAKAAGVVTSMDTSLPDPQSKSGLVSWLRIFEQVLPSVDVFVPSIEEAVFMLRRQDYDAWDGKVIAHLTASYLHALAGDLIAMGAVIVGFKLGAMGFYLRTADAPRFDRLNRLPLDDKAWANVELWVPAYAVTVAGTTGAGDSAYAGFLAALLRGLPPLEAIQWACAVGACNVEKVDATSGIRSWEETRARLDAGWDTRPERLPGW